MKIYLVLIGIFLALGCVQAPVNVSPGLSQAEVIYLLGPPDSSGTAMSDEFFVYGDQKIAFRNGKVSHSFNQFVPLKINSLSSGKDTPKTIAVVSGTPDISEGDLQFIEFKRYIERVLLEKGYSLANDPSAAQTLALLSYKHLRERTLQIQSNVVPMATYIAPSKSYIQNVGRAYGWSQSSTITPGQVILSQQIAYSSNSVTYHDYEIALEVIESQIYRKSGRKIVYWKTTLTNEDSYQSDFRNIFLFMTPAFFESTNYDSHGERAYIVGSSDPRVAYLSGQTSSVTTATLPSAGSSAWGGFDDPMTVNKRNSKGYCPLHVAALLADVDGAKKLLRVGAKVDETDSSDRTPLYYAVDTVSVQMVDLLLESGADPRAPWIGEEEGISTMILAKRKSPSLYDKLLAKVAQLRTQEKERIKARRDILLH